MLRTNLATRPFYNERAVHVGLAVLAVIAVGLALFALVRVVSLSQRQGELSARISRDEAEAARLLQSAARVRQSIDPDELKRVIAAAQEANRIIAHRTFSWTELFNNIEATLPPDVMLETVRPSFDDGRTLVSMTVVGRNVENVGRFMEQLEVSGSFASVLLNDEKRNEDGTYLVTLRGLYQRGGGDAGAQQTADREPGIRNPESENGSRLAMSGRAAAPQARPPASRMEARR